MECFLETVARAILKSVIDSIKHARTEVVDDSQNREIRRITKTTYDCLSNKVNEFLDVYNVTDLNSFKYHR